MNLFLKTGLAIFLIATFTSNTFSQLNGTYTVGSGGFFPTINSAVTTAVSQGVNGPVVFNILSGNYFVDITINAVPGISAANDITFQSQTGVPGDVVIKGNSIIFFINSPYLTFQNLTIDSSGNHSFKITADGDHTTLKNIIFGNNSKLVTQASQFPPEYFHASGCINIPRILLDGRDFPPTERGGQIINNTFTGILELYNYDSLIVENNTAPGIYLNCFNGSISKNKTAKLNIAGSNLLITNNFVYGSSMFYEEEFRIYNCFVIYNTFNSVSRFGKIIIGQNNFVLNNLFINTGEVACTYELTGLNSDYNNYYNSADTGIIDYNTVRYYSVLDFFNSTGLDQHSNSHPVTFVSPTNLHLTGSSQGDLHLAGIPTPLVTDDIDGQPRNPSRPYKGADEVIDIPLPVELVSFSSSVSNNNISLKWTTSSEINNSGFEIQRSSSDEIAAGIWNSIGFVKGNGTTNSQINYEFTDKNLLPEKYSYRLKQIDFNGNYEYHNLSNVVVISVPEKFSLSQNFPNPFNPVTTISYSLPNTQYTILKVYEVNGKEISTLVNQKKEAGVHSIEFNASEYSSGIYFYTLNVNGKNIDTKRMILLK